MCSHKIVLTCRRAALLLTLSLPALCGLSCASKPAAPTSRTLHPAASLPRPVLPRVAAKPKSLLPIAFPDLQTDEISALTFSPDGWHLAIGYGTDAEVSLWNLKTGELTWQRFVNAASGGPIQFDPHGQFLVAEFSDPDSTTPLIVSTLTGQLVRSISTSYYGTPRIERHGRYLVVSKGTKIESGDRYLVNGRVIPNSSDKPEPKGTDSVEVWNTHTWRRVDQIPKAVFAIVPLTVSGRIVRRAIPEKSAGPWQPPSAGYYNSTSSAVRGFLATTDDAKTVEVWNVRSRKRLYRKIFTDDTPRAPAISPDGQTLAVATLGGYVYFWELQTGRLLAKPHCADDVLRCLAFSPNGRVVAAAGGYFGLKDGVHLLDTKTYKVFAVLKVSLAETPNGEAKDWSLNHPEWFAALPDLSYIASPSVVKKIRMPGRARDARTIATFSRPARVRAALRKCWQRER